MALCDQSLPYVRAISPYLPGKPITQLAREMGIPVERIVKLASNENPLGMSPKAKLALEKAVGSLERYPDDFELKSALASHCGVGMERIVLGNGSNDLLDILARVFLAPGRSAVYAQYAFAVYPLATISAGGEPIAVPALNFGHDLDAMRAAIRPDTRLVWMANPNNPTGTFQPGERILAFLRKVPRRVVVVLDEAYTEYLDPSQRYDAIGWVREFPNLVVSRTFSKAYGLAGLRIGVAVAQPPLTDLLNRVRQPFNVNLPAQAAAIAALADSAFLERSRQVNRDGMEQLQAGFDALGLRYLPSHGNFILVEVGDADRINEALLKKGIIVRNVANYGLPSWLRVTIGLPEENAAFLKALGPIVRGV